MKSRDGRTVLRQNYEAMYATEYTKHKNLHLTNEKLMGKTAIEKAGDLIHIIKENSERLLNITGELLNMTQVESGKLQLKELTKEIEKQISNRE